jgi:hypothetical protein
MAKPLNLPVWDKNETNTIQPDTTRQDDGYLITLGIPQKPYIQYDNWQFNNQYKWLKAINERGILEYDNVTDYVANFSYVVGSNGEIYQAVVNNGASSTVVNPVTDDGTTWRIASAPAVIPFTGGGTLISFKINELRDGSSYTLPAANSVGENGYIMIALPDRYSDFTPDVQRAGSDKIADKDSLTHTGISFDSRKSEMILLTSNGTDTWSL